MPDCHDCLFPPIRATPLVIKVPEWVSHSALDKVGVSDVLEGRGPRDVFPRWLRWSEDTTPAVLAGEQRFMRAPAPCRCVVIPSLPNRFAAMRQASQSCRDFLCDLQNRLNEFMGQRGVNDHMLALGREAAQALNWGEFVKGQRQPRVDEYKAFFRLAALLRPVLEKTRWPDILAFPTCSAHMVGY